MTEKEKPKGLVATYNGFIKDNPDEDVFLTRHSREEGDLMCLVTTVTIFRQMFPNAPTDPIGEKKNGKDNDESKKSATKK